MASSPVLLCVLFYNQQVMTTIDACTSAIWVIFMDFVLGKKIYKKCHCGIFKNFFFDFCDLTNVSSIELGCFAG